jgi:phospholipid-binding lipoprotein MlaA
MFFRSLFFTSLVLLLTGCSASKLAENPDPWEGYNRKVFLFNQFADKVAIRPVAAAYNAVLPDTVEKGINNAFDNINQIPTVANDILQWRIGHAVADTWRFAINSTIGIGGLFDVAKSLGLKPHYEDFGLTLRRWGFSTPYFVIPFLGSSTVGDSTALIVDYEAFSIYPRIDSLAWRYSLLGLDFVRLRTNLLPTDDLVRKAFDPYVFVRDAYLQRREYLMNQAELDEDMYKAMPPARVMSY